MAQGQTGGSQSQWNVVDNVNVSLGSHQLKAGIDYRRLAPSGILPAFNASYTFVSEGAVESNNALAFWNRNARTHPLFKNVSAFVQDEWRLSQRLNLSLGLRWDVNPAPSAAGGLKAYTIQGTGPDTWTLAPQGTPLWRTTWYNFAPRIGVAYIARNTPNQTVIRGGAGLFFDTGQQLGAIAFENAPGFTSTATPALQFPGNPTATTPPIVNPPPPGSRYVQIQDPSPHLQLPYALQWSASIQQALGRAQTVGVFYVGSHSGRLLRLTEFRSSTNPLSSLFRIAQNGLSSDYDSLQIQFQQRMSRGLTTLASYAWSHCLDYGSQNYAYGYQRGNCDVDIRSNVSAAFSYDIPNIGGNRFAKLVANHWGIDDRFIARTAFPVILDGVSLLQPDGQIYHAGLNLVPGQPLYLYGPDCDSRLRALGNLKPNQSCPAGRAINPLAFSSVSTGFGNAPRNFARGFGVWQMNFAVRREFPIYEKLKIQFRAEAFNIFNHPNFGIVNPSFGQKTFGQATATLASSLAVLNPLYQMGGARSLQFALRLEF